MSNPGARALKLSNPVAYKATLLHAQKAYISEENVRMILGLVGAHHRDPYAPDGRGEEGMIFACPAGIGFMGPSYSSKGGAESTDEALESTQAFPFEDGKFYINSQGKDGIYDEQRPFIYKALSKIMEEKGMLGNFADMIEGAASEVDLEV